MNKICTAFGIALAGIALLTPRTSHAQLTTFAQFNQVGSGRPFTFTNAGAGSTFSLASTPVGFTYFVDNGYGSPIGTPVAAHMTISSVVAAPASATGTIPNRNLEQAITSVIIHFIADVPVAGKTDLLTIVANAGATSSGGTLTGRENKSTGNLDGSESPFGGDSILMTSDFLLFNGSTQRDYSISMNAITPALGLNGNGYLNSFTASATGTFAVDPPPSSIPEPGTLALFTLGCSGMGIFLKRRQSH
jgi:hypothetical protein